MAVTHERTEDCTFVYASDGLGRRLASASVDGVIAADEAVQTVELEVLAPVVNHIVDSGNLKLATLMCFGEDAAGRADSLIGTDGLLRAAVDTTLTAISTTEGTSLQFAAVLVSMEVRSLFTRDMHVLPYRPISSPCLTHPSHHLTLNSSWSTSLIATLMSPSTRLNFRAYTWTV